MTLQRKRRSAVPSWSTSTLAVAALCVLAPHSTPSTTAGRQSEEGRDDRPSLSLRSSATVAFSSRELLFIAELEGGADDYQEFYCPSLEWDWDDATKSEATYDCEPYEPGKSEIQRRYSSKHTFQEPGSYEVKFRLKRRDKILIAARTKVTVRYGLPPGP